MWGYDPGFMALMPAALAVAPEDIAAGDVWVATGADGQIAGVVALAPGNTPGTLELNKLFIEPRHIHGGVGHALLAHAVAEAQQRGAKRLTILADPNAAGFYERNGAVRIGEAPSGRGARPRGLPAAGRCLVPVEKTATGKHPKHGLCESARWPRSLGEPSRFRPTAC